MGATSRSGYRRGRGVAGGEAHEPDRSRTGRQIGERAATGDQRAVVLDDALQRLPGEIEPIEIGVAALELGDAAVCVQQGTTTELNLADFFKSHNMEYKVVAFEKNEEVLKAYQEGRCDAYSTDQSGLYAERLALKNPDDHIVLPEIISKEPLGPLVRQGDDAWFNVIKWTYFALLTAGIPDNTAAVNASQAIGTTKLTGANQLMLASWALVLLYFVMEHIIKIKIYGTFLVPVAVLLMGASQILGGVLEPAAREVSCRLDSRET